MILGCFWMKDALTSNKIKNNNDNKINYCNCE